MRLVKYQRGSFFVWVYSMREWVGGGGCGRSKSCVWCGWVECTAPVELIASHPQNTPATPGSHIPPPVLSEIHTIVVLAL